MTGISVIVPTYEDWPLVRRTLMAVVYDAVRLGVDWELIVVDNESDARFQKRVQGLVRHEALRFFRRTGLGGRHFQPGAARNVGIEMAKHDCLVFLDSDCVPAAGLLRLYWETLSVDRENVLMGHRVFVDTAHLDAHGLASRRALLDAAPRVPSASNYGLIEDRRLPELRELDAHPRPYDCLFSCNFALHRSCLGALRFSSIYDGYWGYEDIDLGYRLHLAGRGFRYMPEAHVYHQEGGSLSAQERIEGRRRNFDLLSAAVPGFRRYRAASRRPASLPATV